MSDEDRWTSIVDKFAEGQVIDEGEARFIASQWHGGQNSALYAFASTGTILDGLEDEITSDCDSADKIDLQALLDYLKQQR